MFIIPHSKGKWIVRSVAKSKNDLFSSRCKFPDDVCGLQKEDLKSIQGFDKFMFIHKNGHMGVIESDIEDAIKFAKNLILLNSLN
jgi:uncharacterized UPF0160 family protein